MTTSPTSAERAALRVAHAVPLESSNPGYSLIDQIVFALGSAQLLMAPETAAELARLRARAAELEAGLPVMQEALFKALDRVTELEAERQTTNAALVDVTVALRAAESGQAPEADAPSQVLPLVVDVPVPVVLTEVDGPVMANNASARASSARLRKLLHPLDKGVRS
ncbi:hypothetical protein [Streptomyces sp. NPDC005970]|uniref:hypothetical protein n=1 Tax=Streptomyces sp. NPDC005970 TaxID=3156723 RepID=UPI00340BEA25